MTSNLPRPTAIAGLVTVYTFVDMVRFNKMRKAEFAEAQKKLRADSLEAARIAYVTGTATEEQMRLIEEAAERSAAAAEVSGLGSEGKTGFKLPPILGPPMAAKRTTRETLSDGKSGAGKEGENATQVVATSSASAAAGGFWTTDDAAASTPATGTTAEPPKKSSVGFFGSLFGPWSTKQPTGQQQKPVDGAGSPSGRAQQQSTAEPAQSNGGEKKKGWW